MFKAAKSPRIWHNIEINRHTAFTIFRILKKNLTQCCSHKDQRSPELHQFGFGAACSIKTALLEVTKGLCRAKLKATSFPSPVSTLHCRLLTSWLCFCFLCFRYLQAFLLVDHQDEHTMLLSHTPDPSTRVSVGSFLMNWPLWHRLMQYQVHPVIPSLALCFVAALITSNTPSLQPDLTWRLKCRALLFFLWKIYAYWFAVRHSSPPVWLNGLMVFCGMCFLFHHGKHYKNHSRLHVVL